MKLQTTWCLNMNGGCDSASPSHLPMQPIPGDAETKAARRGGKCGGRIRHPVHSPASLQADHYKVLREIEVDDKWIRHPVQSAPVSFVELQKLRAQIIKEEEREKRHWLLWVSAWRASQIIIYQKRLKIEPLCSQFSLFSFLQWLMLYLCN